MLESPLSRFTFTQRYELSGSDVTAQLSEVFGVSDNKIFDAIPQLRNPGDRKYKFKQPPPAITPQQEGDIIIMLDGTGKDPLGTFVIKTSEGIKTYTYRAFWQDYLYPQEKIE
ncbi:MAG: hypothetical protein ACD_28C00379G0001 [uncultured bacterium]|nr:MAG: hypothetical protein ACD_28C00379G0001 [uncultured bacterium]KKT74014.1 MAG: hypothetical protein UW70_C0069G0008 [Candidatus Peregrinibacteria bacterium GW2011_GWA2_44_7]